MSAKADFAPQARKDAHISVQRYFEISLLFMLGTSFITIATTGKLDPISVAVLSGVLIAKLASFLRDTEFLLSPRTVTRLAVFYLFFYPLDFLIFSPGPAALDRMLQATVHLILFATAVKVLSARTYRDYGYLATLSFMLMLASAVLTIAAAYLACFTAYVLFAISTFISYEIKRATEAAPRASEGPFRAPRQNRTAIEKALGWTTLGLATGIVLLGTVLFFVIPRYRTRYLTGLGGQAQNITGFSESVNLGDVRKILRSNAVVMRVLFDGSPRQLQGIKWRGVALTTFDGHHWFNENTAQFPQLPASFERFELPRLEGWQNHPHRALRYGVLLSAISTDVLFAAAVPREVAGHIRLLNLDETDSLHNPQHVNVPIRYEVLSDAGLPSPEQLRRASTDYSPDVRLVYLVLPEIDPRVTEFARQLTASANNNYDRAFAIQNHLRGNFGYTLDPPSIDPAHPIESFLFKAKKGYCEYFAAAMTVMLRTQGIPARLVNGFLTGSYNRIGKDFVVRARDAHSWVEVYFPEYGWVPFDPTPSDPAPVLPSALDDYLDALGLFWGEWIVNYDFAHWLRVGRAIEQDSNRFQQNVRQRVQHYQRLGVWMAYRVEGWLMSHKLLMLLLMLAVLAGLFAADRNLSLTELRFLWAWTFPGHARSRIAAPEHATLSYQQLLRVLRKMGFRKGASETPREFALTFGGTRWSVQVLEFTRLYNALRYGQAPVPLARLRQLVDEIGQTPQ